MRVAKQLRDGELRVELLDDDGTVIPAVSPFLRHLRARGCSPNTLLGGPSSIGTVMWSTTLLFLCGQASYVA